MGPDPRWRWPAALVLPAIVLVALAAIDPFFPWRSPDAIPFVAAFAFVCVTTEVIAAGAFTPPLGRRSLLALPCLAVVLVALAWAGPNVSPMLAAAIVTSTLLAFGTTAGSAIGHAIQRPGHLMIVAAISALVDVFSVLHSSGPTHRILEEEQIVSVLVLPWPLLGTGAIEPVLGVGDVAFAALYLAAGKQHGLSLVRTIAALAIGFAFTFATVWIIQRGIPALPFLGAAIVVAHPQVRSLPRDERRTAFVGVALLALVFGALFVLE